MKIIRSFCAYLMVPMLLLACSESTSVETTDSKEVIQSNAATTDTITKKQVQDEGVNVSIKGASIDLGGDGGKVETKTGTDIQVNKQGVKMNSKDVNINVGNRQ